MKKFTLLSCLVLVLLSGATFAQKSIGGHLAYGTEVESFAIGVNAEIFVHEKISIAPNFTYYFPKKDEASYSFGGFNYSSEIKYNYWELNLDGHYYFTDPEGSTAFYGLLGLNILGIKFKQTVEQGGQSVSSSDSDTEVGLNIGAGVNFNTGNVIPFGELKFETVGDGQLVIMAGVRFPLGR